MKYRDDGGDVVMNWDRIAAGGTQRPVNKRMLFHLRSAVRGAACRDAARGTDARLRSASHAEEPRGTRAAGRFVRLVVRSLLAVRAAAGAPSGDAANSTRRARGGTR